MLFLFAYFTRLHVGIGQPPPNKKRNGLIRCTSVNFRLKYNTGIYLNHNIPTDSTIEESSEIGSIMPKQLTEDGNKYGSNPGMSGKLLYTLFSILFPILIQITV